MQPLNCSRTEQLLPAGCHPHPHPAGGLTGGNKEEFTGGGQYPTLMLKHSTGTRDKTLHGLQVQTEHEQRCHQHCPLGPTRGQGTRSSRACIPAVPRGVAAAPDNGMRAIVCGGGGRAACSPPHASASASPPPELGSCSAAPPPPAAPRCPARAAPEPGITRPWPSPPGLRAGASHAHLFKPSALPNGFFIPLCGNPPKR